MSTLKTFKLEILAVKEETLVNAVSSLTVQNKNSSFAILADHAPLIAVLEQEAQVLAILDSGAEERLNLNGGILEVKNNLVQIFKK